jgi:N-acetylmuramoyl-L-alanine amidase
MKNEIRLRINEVARWANWSTLVCSVVLLLFSGMCPNSFTAYSRVTKQTTTFLETFEAEQRLLTLGYWTGPIDGVFDGQSRHALIAFQKVESRKRTGKLTGEELEAIRRAVTPLPQYTGYPHVEVDIRRQVLLMVDESDAVNHILPVCTGSEEFYLDHGQVHRAHTPLGQFRVLRKILGPRLSSLGFLYYPNYIYEGIAIHGSWAMTVYPDSHGCIRIPMSAARQFSELVPLGTEVVVY